MGMSLDDKLKYYKEEYDQEKEKRHCSDGDGAMEHFGEKVEKYQRITETSEHDDDR